MECVNQTVLRGLQQAFGSEEDADCVIVFCRDEGEPGAAEGSSTSVESVFGPPLPAHRLILRWASDRFKAQLERWPPAKGPTDLAGVGYIQQSASQPQSSAAAAAATAISSPLPQLRVPLGDAAEVPAARAAIRFGYTGEVEAGGVRELLLVRRQAAYLQMHGCTAACDRALVAKLQQDVAVQQPAARAPVCGGKAGSGSGTGRGSKRARTAEGQDQQQQQSQLDFQQLYELYDGEALWPEDPGAEGGTFAAVLESGKRALVAHFRDALAVVNTPSLYVEAVSLLAVAMEALLSSDDFGTDNESSVLLLLAIWIRGNHAKTDADIRLRLCRTVRLTHLSRPYLSLVLPALASDHEKDPEGPVGWFPLNVLGAAFVSNFASASEAERKALVEAGNTPWAMESLTAPPRVQCIPPASASAAALSYSWIVPRGAMLEAVEGLEGDRKYVHVGFDGQWGCGGVYAGGFRWLVCIELVAGQPAAAGLVLSCSLPNALEPSGSLLEAEGLPSTVVPISARVTVHRWREDGTRNDVQLTLRGSKDFVEVGYNFGWDDVLTLRQPPPPQQPQAAAAGGGGAVMAAADPLAAWVDYLRDDKITGTLTLLPPV